MWTRIACNSVEGALQSRKSGQMKMLLIRMKKSTMMAGQYECVQAYDVIHVCPTLKQRLAVGTPMYSLLQNSPQIIMQTLRMNTCHCAVQPLMLAYQEISASA